MDPHPTLNSTTSLIAFQTSATRGNYFNISALALLVYEYILLLDKEIDLFWNRKVTGASVLFLLNRYLPIIAYVIRPSTKMIQMSCLSNTIMQFVSQTLAFLQYVPWAAFSALRAFALYKRPYNWPIAVLVFVLSCVSIAANFARFYWTVPVHWTFDGNDCLVYEVHPPLNVEAYLGARACLIIADTIVLYITLRATSHKLPRLMRNSILVIANKRDTFSNILLRDGVVYFRFAHDECHLPYAHHVPDPNQRSNACELHGPTLRASNGGAYVKVPSGSARSGSAAGQFSVDTGPQLSPA